MKKIGIILSGCGFLDGAEIRESVFTLLAADSYLSRKDFAYEIVFLSQDKNTHHTINHLIGEEDKNPRNMLQESARIARGKISKLSDIQPNTLDALLIPGGFGVAKNFSEFAFKGADGEVNNEFSQFVQEVHNNQTPIAGICIAPAILAQIFGSKGVQVTIGNDSKTKEQVERTGAKHKDCQVTEICIDEEHKIVTTPAYMFDDAKPHEVFTGIKECVEKTLSMMK